MRKKLTKAMNKMMGKPKNTRTRSNEEANIVIGPVIGKVTATTARVLIELDRTATVTVSLTLVEDPQSVLYSRTSKSKPKNWAGSQGDPYGIERKTVGNRPAVFEFTGLRPGCRYQVGLTGCKGGVGSSGFCTFSEEWKRLNVGVVSCNKIFITHMEIPIHSDLWADLARNIDAGGVDLVLHLGDQVYGDGDKLMDKQVGEEHDKWSDRFRLCKEEMMKDVPKHQWHTKYEEVCEAYREVYRETWQHPPTAHCLANCPNIMIYDDHEIRDNWADSPEDWDPETLDFFIARCAWIVYLEYQRQLDRDIDFKKLKKFDKDHHFHVINGVGLMFLDVRGCRSFIRVDNNEFPYLGSKQWKDIDESLSPGGFFASVRLLLVCTPAPLVFLEPKITDAAGKNVPRLVDFRGHWSADIHRKEQTRMIDALVAWKNSGRREVMVLGGDVHCGGHSHIMKDGVVLFNQMTTSAIANRPLPKPAYYFMRAAGRLGILGNDYRFRHHHWTRSRNYGLMNIINYRPQDAGDVKILAHLVIGKFVGGIIQGQLVKNTDKDTVKCGCFEAY